MNKLIDCFVPVGNEEETERNVQALDALDITNDITIVETSMTSTETLQAIAGMVKTPYTLLYLKHQFIRTGYLALERMVQIAEATGAGMLYADHYNVSADGLRTEASGHRLSAGQPTQ